MIARIQCWWIALLNALGLYTKSQIETLRKSNDTLKANNLTLKTTVATLQSMNGALRNRNGTLEDQFNIERTTLLNEIEQLEIKLKDAEDTAAKLRVGAEYDRQYIIEQYRTAPDENLELIKNLQKQLGELFREHPVFGFPGSIPVPGSTCVVSSSARVPDGPDRIIVRGRSILTDDMTSRIDNETSPERRFILIRDYMSRYDILSKVARELIRYGAIGLSLAYNTDCTAYEVYYEVIADTVKDPILMIDTDKRVTDK